MNRRRPAATIVLLVFLGFLGLGRLHANGGIGSIDAGDLRTWLTFLASDELQGRAVFSEGLGLAASYIQGHLSAWGVTPAGDRGTYFQTVQVHSVRATHRSSVTVRVGSTTRTFLDGHGVTFPKFAGGKRTLTVDRVEFVGYGLDIPNSGLADYKGKDVSGGVAVFLGARGPKALEEPLRRLLGGRSRYALDQQQAIGTVGPPPRDPERGRTQPRNGRDPSAADFTTTQRLDRQVPPAIAGSDDFFKFLFSQAPVHYAELKRKADEGAPLPGFRLDGVSVTFTIDADYVILRTELTRNVVGVVEGRDPDLKSSYVAFGAHYDHVGYADREPVSGDGRRVAPGRVTPGATDDRIWNGADDDGSGTTALMAIARAFQQGERPKRSVLFVWHAGEERGLYGSRYFTDYPTVPLDRIVAQLNVDMIGRNRNDEQSQANTVFLVGSDRISTELHQMSRKANASLQPPLALDYEMNDPADPEQVYYRSDHYSYAAKGIPIIFFTTGLHPDYHANTDEVSKIEFSKMARIAQLIYETGRLVANMDSAPVRDRKGPRAVKGSVS